MSDQKKTAVIAKLNETRQTLLTAVADFNDAHWNQTVFSEGSEWTVADTLRHLAEAQRGMIGLIQLIQQGGEGVPADFDLDRWNASRIAKTKSKTPADILQQLDADRAALLQLIDTLQAGDWGKEGRHGSMEIMSIEQICLIIAEHETIHANDMQTAVR